MSASQKPQATNVAGMWAWNQLGRRVKRGEKGIAILAPMIAKVRKEDRNNDGEADKGPQRAVLGFRRVYVWDVSSTDGEPLPEPVKVTGEAGGSLNRLRDYVNAQGIALEYNESIAPALGMAFGNTIRLLPGQTDAETFTTLVHELAHLMLKHSERRSAITKTVRETEAEAIAFVVSKAVGLTTLTARAASHSKGTAISAVTPCFVSGLRRISPNGLFLDCDEPILRSPLFCSVSGCVCLAGACTPLPCAAATGAPRSTRKENSQNPCCLPGGKPCASRVARSNRSVWLFGKPFHSIFRIT